ncbi:TMV resistance protein [Vigna angularis]|uniref:TMV resistance protein n=2 Tax=Phaseolus angularis TaxID=3914 RepID=A0A8T0JFR9_PHAAN|nr:disease resistance protein Roq1 isoform X1 [Vigna angularis]XP_052726564.1 disease resistance protein Roq1 isoform X1 [Vigna angularis]XP_052726565.1 disease resistance protein Roq1 isoform X1 [Vigna angularis]XP_052726566.1 disease resistance protein Roq1 isoform X1 [Vigna angularis]XP_052726567.1 disease resistance protein Roq1 isoform X1 [Vigna angularis]XP_052726568.1 disease resistance protein Roq1 isoform X1 [Vigna angularis]XP_052726569.1 disease resistance protein Roq1 isoform X1 [
MSEGMTVSDPTAPIGPSVVSDAIIHHTPSSSHSYDVFVSFRGEDTRNNFTSFLFGDLHRAGIVAFRDDECIKKGDFIAPELLQAIQGSRLFVVVLSKNYASSTWCLRELVEIFNCCETSPRPVIPIFYDVEPTTVRNQKGCYEKAFAEHENRFREDKVKMEEVQRWKEALRKLANISGSDIGNKPQNEQIEKIVQEIINNLRPKFLNLPRDQLVGIEDRVQDLGNILRFDLNDVRVVGISGMGGIGKTTLARALYERICHQYKYRCFIDDVSKIFLDSRSMGLQKQLISQTLNEKSVKICNVTEGTCLVQSKLNNAKALIVFDNVDQVQQLRIFSGNRDNLLRECLGGGSRIIIVSRDEQILKIHGVDDIYQVGPLERNDAIQLFCRNAFKVNYILSDYEKLADKILSHVEGHPLAIETIGSSLFGRSLSQWKSVLEGLKENKSKNIMDILRISYIQLEEKYKQTFLDIACFFNSYDEECVKEILNFRGFHPEDSIQVLIDKSLITRDFYDGMTIKMHSLLVDLGRCIVREVSPKEPIKWSRLWTRKDLHDAMSENEATRNLEAIVLEDDQERDDVEIPDETIKADGLSKIKHLKLLSVRYVNFSGSLSHLSNELGYLVWYEYPFECLPQSFQPHKLVELSLNGRSIQRLWEGTKPLPNLKRLDLAFCESLVEMPDVAEALNLEWINLEGCVKLQKLNPSIGSLRKLVLLNLRHCKKLVILSNTILGLSSIKYLDVCGCSIIDSICLLDETRNTEPSSPLSYLCELDLSFCNLVEIPDYIGKLRCLESLNLEGNNFVKLPNLKDLLRLYYLNLQDCKLLKYLPDLPSRTVLPLEPSTLSRFSSSILGWPDLLFSSNRTGLIIIGCPELVEIEQCTTKSFSWAIQILEATYHHGTDKCLFPESIIPGSQIPSLFNNEFVNVDIEYLDKENVTVDPPPVPHDNNFIGVLCCVIFRLDHKQNPMNFRRDHMWLHYENVSIHIHPYPPFLLRSIISLLGYKGFVTVDVKKVQYRWVNEQDLINLKMTHCANLTARKRKISVIEENG